jgi:multiple sugar transport system permease protein
MRILERQPLTTRRPDRRGARRAAGGPRPLRLPVAYPALIAFAVVFLVPAAWVLVSSFKSDFEVGSANWIPRAPTLDNYSTAVTMVDFPHYLKNSVILATSFTVLNTLSSSLAGYAFARLRAPGKDKLFLLALSTLLIPNLVTFVPQFVLFSKLGWVNTYWPWIAWGAAGSAFHIFLFRQFFLNFPRELEEAAEIDGCSLFRIYWNIFLPNSLPVLATSAIFSFAWVWGDYLFPGLLLDTEHTTLGAAVATGYYSPQGIVILAPLMAGIVLYAVPLILVFLFVQRYIVQGLVTSGLR